MIQYILGRLLLLIPVLLGVSLVVFLLLWLSPGDPAQLILGPEATPENVAKLRAEWGLNDPLPVQYGRFVMHALQGDLGQSYRSRQPVTREVLPAFPATAQLATGGLLVALVLGIPAGIISATRQYSLFDNLSMIAALMGISMPIFWTGLLLILLFAHYIPLLPTSGYGTWQHLVLPSLALGSASAALVARMTRSSMLEVLGEDFVRTARAKGLAERTVVYGHALRNAAIPVITTFGLQFGLLLGGSVIVETVFAWPGVGRLVVSAILSRDAPVVAGAVLLIATNFVVANIVVDLLYGVVDPRIRYS